MYFISTNKKGEILKINRTWCMPNSRTFSIKPIRKLIESYANAKAENKSDKRYIVLDPFANEFSIGTIFDKNIFTSITNDLDESYSTDYHKDATDFLMGFEENSIDFILYDPPYSPRQVSESYKKLGKSVNMQTTQSSYWSNQKKEISRILKKDGIVITFGWNSGGIGKSNGLDIVEILMVAHGGWHNDTICTVERKR